MAVALATLPLKSAADDDWYTFLATGVAAGTGLADAGLAGVGFPAGLAAGVAAGLWAATFVAVLATGFTDLAGAFFAGACFTGVFFTAPCFTTTFFVAALPVGTLRATALVAGGFLDIAFFFTATFFATGFAAAFFAGAAFAAAGLTATFLAGLAAFLAVTGLAAAFFATGLATARLDFFAGTLPTPLAATFFAADPFDLPVLVSFALAEALLFCALAAVELRVVFAISLHRGWPWRPGVIAHVSCTSKLTSGILVPLHAAGCFGKVNVVTRLILLLLRFYKRWLSPLLGPRCRFHPSCSDYARIAVIRFGPWRGSLLAGWRLLRCQPLCIGGEDPVPEHFRLPRCHARGTPPHTH